MPTYTYECQVCRAPKQHQSISPQPFPRAPRSGRTVKPIYARSSPFLVKEEGASASHCGRATHYCRRSTRSDKPTCAQQGITCEGPQSKPSNGRLSSKINFTYESEC